MSYKIRMPLPDEHVQSVQQSFFLEKDPAERKGFYIYPRYVYDDPMAVTDPTLKGAPCCWVIKGELFQWLKDQGVSSDDVLIDMATRHKGWVMYLPKRIATLYKLTWL